MFERSRDKKILLQYLSILIASAIITFFFAKYKKFPYEINPNTIWKHKDLIAEFDFAVQKTPEEIEQEIDSIKKNSYIFCRYDYSVRQSNLKKFSEYLDQIIEEYLKKNKKEVFRKDLYTKFRNQSIITLKYIYEKGVYNPEKLPKEINFTKFIIQKDNQNYIYFIDELFTVKKAIEYFKEKLREYLSDNNLIINNIVYKINLDQFISENIIYDPHLTHEMIEKSVKLVSKTRGYIKNGEILIKTGEFVDKDKYSILNSYKQVYEQQISTKERIIVTIATVILVFMLLLMLFYHISHLKPQIVKNFNEFVLYLSLILLFITIFKISSLAEENYLLFILPFAILPIIIKTIYNEQLAILTTIITTYLITIICQQNFNFFILEFFSSILPIIIISRRKNIFSLYSSSFIVFFTLSGLYTLLSVIENGNFEKIEVKNYGIFFLNGILVMLTLPFLYYIEKIFRITSEFTLLELSNTNHRLLQKLSATAPGTFQHSIEVASLAEGAANEIGANALLCKVGALYHDIGKIMAPSFFSENQIYGYNPHDNFEYKESAKIIIMHVKYGIEIAKKYKIPEEIIDFIRTHHGTTIVQFFYKKHINQNPDKAYEIEDFTYPGPKPFSKETAIVMMADAIEATCRSLTDHSAEVIAETIDRIIDNQLALKQFETAPLTFEEIKKLKKFFKLRLINLYHIRIQYPK